MPHKATGIATANSSVNGDILQRYIPALPFISNLTDYTTCTNEIALVHNADISILHFHIRNGQRNVRLKHTNDTASTRTTTCSIRKNCNLIYNYVFERFHTFNRTGNRTSFRIRLKYGLLYSNITDANATEVNKLMRTIGSQNNTGIMPIRGNVKVNIREGNIAQTAVSMADFYKAYAFYLIADVAKSRYRITFAVFALEFVAIAKL